MKIKYAIHYNKHWPEGIYGMWIKKWYGWVWAGGTPIKFCKDKTLNEVHKELDWHYEHDCY